MNWFAAVHAALIEADPADKCAATAVLAEPVDLDACLPLQESLAGVPGRPLLPELVGPGDVPQRGFGSVDGRAALVHAVAHIEFNAVNLALDACWRFRGMPQRYYADWLSVARDEARHFLMLSGRLSELGHAYGDFKAHNGLWDAAEQTREDVMVRMALVPRVLEARGLDVTPGIIAKLRQAGDLETVRVLEVILSEEVRHVAIGSRWFQQLCTERGLDPVTTFRNLLARHGMTHRQVFNVPARLAAGFTQAELDGLQATRVNPAASARKNSQ